MTASEHVGLLFEAWSDQALDGLDASAVVDRAGGGSSFAWTAAHATTQLDSRIDVRFANSRTRS